eukprot:366150-Chlamydomonas_euryale.AAC.10
MLQTLSTSGRLQRTVCERVSACVRALTSLVVSASFGAWSPGQNAILILLPSSSSGLSPPPQPLPPSFLPRPCPMPAVHPHYLLPQPCPMPAAHPHYLLPQNLPYASCAPRQSTASATAPIRHPALTAAQMSPLHSTAPPAGKRVDARMILERVDTCTLGWCSSRRQPPLYLDPCNRTTSCTLHTRVK